MHKLNVVKLIRETWEQGSGSGFSGCLGLRLIVIEELRTGMRTWI